MKAALSKKSSPLAILTEKDLLKHCSGLPTTRQTVDTNKKIPQQDTVTQQGFQTVLPTKEFAQRPVKLHVHW